MELPLLTPPDGEAIPLLNLDRAANESLTSRRASMVSTTDISEAGHATGHSSLLSSTDNISAAPTALNNPPTAQLDNTEDLQRQMPGSPAEGRPPARPQRSRKAVVTVQVFMLLWLVPVITLLVLNFQGFIIGASAWCYRGDCGVDHFTAAKDRSQDERYSRESRNLVGVLQVVAKALEVWFVFITFSLVFLVTMKLAEHPYGLPLGFVTRPFQYADISSLFEGKLWTSFPPRSKVAHDLHIQAFITFSIFLCLLCTVMGPAIAVMAIPALQWRNTEVSI